MGSDHEYWGMQLMRNMGSYGILLLPAFLLVFLSRRKKLPSFLGSFILVRIFIHGMEKYNNLNGGQGDVENQLYSGVDSDDGPNKGRDKRRGSITSGSSHLVASSSLGSSLLDTNHLLLLIYCFLGLQGSFLIWGILQEKIMTTTYRKEDSSGDGTDFQFQDSQFLVLVNRVLAFLFASGTLLIKHHAFCSMWKRAFAPASFRYQNLPTTSSFTPSSGSSGVGTAGPFSSGASKEYLIPPMYEFSFCSVSNILSSWCQYEALKFVNFPTQVLSKACKLLPVMLVSQLVSGKKYKAIEYTTAVMVSLGMILFLAGNQSQSHSEKDPNNQELSLLPPFSFSSSLSSSSSSSSPLDPLRARKMLSIDGLEPGSSSSTSITTSLLDGILILFLYLTFDSFTSNWQEKLNKKYRVSPLQMMSCINFFSILLTSTSLAQQSRLLPSFHQVLSCPELTRDCVLLSIFSASGQLFIFYTISQFGALVFTFIMTLRQCLAIILSCIIYGHALTVESLLGVCIVFVALFGQIYFKSRNRK